MPLPVACQDAKQQVKATRLETSLALTAFSRRSESPAIGRPVVSPASGSSGPREAATRPHGVRARFAVLERGPKVGL